MNKHQFINSFMSCENAKKRDDEMKAKKKKLSKKEIMRQLHDPNVSEEEKSVLMEELYKGLEIK